MSRKFLMGKTMDEDMAAEFIEFIEKANDESETDPITLIINSNGGFIFALYSMLSAIRYSKAPIIGHVYGECYSFAVPILLACNKKVASPFANFMLHDVSCAYSKQTRLLTEWQELMQNMTDTRKFYTEFVVSHSNITHEFLETIYSKKIDYHFNTDEAIELGIIDRVI